MPEFNIDRLKSKLIFRKHTTFFTNMLYTLKCESSDEVEAVTCDGETIRFNPTFMSGLSDAKQQFTLIHEICHVAFGHLFRGKGLDPELWNQACDYWTNSYLRSIGFELLDDSLISTKYHHDDAVLDIYRKLEQEQQEDNPEDDDNDEDADSDKSDDDGDADPNDSDDEGGDNDCDGGGNSPSDNGSRDPMARDIAPDTSKTAEQREKQEQTIKDNVLRASIEAERANEAGNLPGGLQRMIDEYLNPVVPWSTVLANYLAAKYQDDYTWSKPNRRYQDIYMPTVESEGMGRISIYIDCSVSVSQEEYMRELSEAQAIKDTFNPEEMVIIFFNQGIVSETTFLRDEPLVIDLPVSGGTDISPVLTHIIDHPADVAVVFTDGYFYTDDREPDTPVFWGIVNNESFTYPFGTVLEIKV